MAYNSERITRWFHTALRDGTPAESVLLVTNLFIETLKSKNLAMAVPEKQFRQIICEATCTLKLYSRNGYELSHPRRRFRQPSGWNDDIEAYWQEFVHFHLCNEAFWNLFWKRIPDEVWEDYLPTWRSTLQTILPLYIQRDMEILIAYGYIVENEEGEFVSNEDYEEPQQEYDSYYG